MMSAFADDFRPEADINLGVGYVNEETIPRERILEAMRTVLDHPQRYPTALNYGGSRGSRNLISAIRGFLVANAVGGLTTDVLDRREIVIGPNGATSLLESAALTLEPGIVLTSDPMYYIYCEFLARRGFQVVAVSEDGEGIRIDLLERRLVDLGERRRDIRFLYVVTVNNPTGTILSNDRREALVRIAGDLSRQLGRQVPLILDRAYEDLVHDPGVPPLVSGLIGDGDGLVYEVGTLSKILAPALRIGYLIGSPGPFLDAVVQRTSDSGFSAPLINQEIAAHLLEHHVSDQIRKVNTGYREKARAIQEWIDRDLGNRVCEQTGGGAGFYIYLTLRDVETTEDSRFFTYLARTTGDPEIDGTANDPHPRVIYLPGSFCVHPEGDLVGVGRRQLRLSYGFEELPRIEQAIGMMKRAADYAQEGSVGP
jgi:GntR family transcriptional regulator of abcA and norABC